jgi:hypothetical protein
MEDAKRWCYQTTNSEEGDGVYVKGSWPLRPLKSRLSVGHFVKQFSHHPTARKLFLFIYLCGCPRVQRQAPQVHARELPRSRIFFTTSSESEIPISVGTFYQVSRYSAGCTLGCRKSVVPAKSVLTWKTHLKKKLKMMSHIL